MPRFIRVTFVLALLVLCGAQSTMAGQGRQGGGGGPATPPPPRQEPQRSIEIDEVPVFFREDWQYDHSGPNVNSPSASLSIQSRKGTS